MNNDLRKYLIVLMIPMLVGVWLKVIQYALEETLLLMINRQNIIIVSILIQILGLVIVLFCFSMSQVESGEAEYHFNRLQL